MANTNTVVEKLSLFNNRSLTKAQWEIVFQGCGCPKSSHFWTAIRENNMYKSQKLYTLVDLTTESYNSIIEKYLFINREAVKRCAEKKREQQRFNERKAEAQKKAKAVPLRRVYIVNGCVTTERPEREW